jgi:pimeloyl-ACP methyl ester carboxylesterase
VIIPPVRDDGSGTLILGFAGNASNAAAIAEFLAAIYPEHQVAAFHYRGYAPSAGAPSAAALLEDAPLVHDFVRERLRPKRLVAIGISIGSGVASGLAGRRPLDGLILVTPFDSLEEVARQRFPWLPVSWLIRHSLPSADTLSRSPVPVAVVAAQHDGVVPHGRARRCRSKPRPQRDDPGDPAQRRRLPPPFPGGDAGRAPCRAVVAGPAEPGRHWAALEPTGCETGRIDNEPFHRDRLGGLTPLVALAHRDPMFMPCSYGTEMIQLHSRVERSARRIYERA